MSVDLFLGQAKNSAWHWQKYIRLRSAHLHIWLFQIASCRTMLHLNKLFIMVRWGRTWMPQSEMWRQWQTSSCLPSLFSWPNPVSLVCHRIILQQLIVGSSVRNSHLPFISFEVMGCVSSPRYWKTPTWQVSWCWRGWASEGKELSSSVNNCLPRWLQQMHLSVLCWVYVCREVSKLQFK